MRIISGSLKSKKILTNKNFQYRPTTSKNREAIFNTISNLKFFKQYDILRDSVFLDMFCGSGIMGIEAISRGAKKVYFIDNNAEQLKLLTHNINLLNIQEKTKIIRSDIKFLPIADIKFDIIFIDPPYFFQDQKEQPDHLKFFHGYL